MIVASSGANAPAIMLNSVVLPAPFGPITAKISPSATSKRHAVDRDEPAEALRHAGRQTEARSCLAAPVRGGARATARCRPAAPSRPPAGRCRRTPAWRRGSPAERMQELGHPLGQARQQECTEDRTEQRADAADDRREDQFDRARDVKDLLGEQVVVDRTRRTRPRPPSCRPRSPPRSSCSGTCRCRARARLPRPRGSPARNSRCGCAAAHGRSRNASDREREDDVVEHHRLAAQVPEIVRAYIARPAGRNPAEPPVKRMWSKPMRANSANAMVRIAK